MARLIEGAHGLTSEGVALSEKVNEIFQQVEAHAQSASGRMSEIQTSTEELVRGIDEINSATHHLDSQTQRNATIASENAATSAFVKQQSESLNAGIALLEQLISVDASATPSTASFASGSPAVSRHPRHFARSIAGKPHSARSSVEQRGVETR